MSVADYHLSDRSHAMGCPKITPADSPHEVHAGTRIGAGVFVNDGVLCVHRDPTGADVALLASITLDSRFASAIRDVPPGDNRPTVAGVDLAEAKSRRKRDR